MFDNYVGAQTRKRPKWVIFVLAFALVAHAGVGGALIVKQFWTITKLAPPESGVELSLGPPPPPPPPKGGGKKKQDSLKDKIKKVKVKETVQPVKDAKEPDPSEVVDSADEGDDFGVEGGVEGGVAGGVVGGVLGGVPGGVLGGSGPPPPPPEPEKPQVVPQQALQANRISGDPNITAPDTVKNLMVKQNQDKVIATAKMCLDNKGNVTTVKMVKSSGYAEYDQKILNGMRGWKYRPFQVNGKAVPVCTAITFIYKFK